MSALRFGIIGCGVIHSTHAQAVMDLPDTELLAVADIVPEKARAAGEKFGVAWFTDYRAMLARPDIDAVCVCTPSGMHGEHAVAAMRAGKHCLVEKPMEIRPEAVAEMLRVRNETGRRLGVISQHRWDKGVNLVKRLVDEGKLGRLAMVNCYTHWYRSQEYYDSGDWRGTWALDGGGALMNQSIHYIDLLQWVGGPVEAITAYTATLTHERIEVEDNASATVRFRNGAVGVIQGTTSAYPGLATRLEIYAEKGSAVVEGDQLIYLEVAGDASYTVRRDQAAEGASGAADPAAIFGGAHRAQIADFAAAVREEREPMVNGEEGRRPVEIILAIYASARQGKEVRLG